MDGLDKKNMAIVVSTLLKTQGMSLEDIVQSPDLPQETRYLTLAAAARYCSVSKYTISRAVKSKALPQIKLSQTKQGSVLVDKSDLERWLNGLKTKNK